MYTYSAYGELIAIHNGAAAVVGTIGQANLESLAATNKLYNGEGFDTRTGLYNFRARNYSASLGRFERLDPFAGNPTDPFSFNKYGYVHGNPVMGADPTGMMFNLNSLMSVMGMSGDMRNKDQSASLTAREQAKDFLIDTLIDTFDFREPKDHLSKRKAAAGERLWVRRLQALHYIAVPLQNTPIGSHGPDMIALKITPKGVSILVGEVKALSSSRVISALDSWTDDTMQMSLKWLSHYADMLVAGIVRGLSEVIVNASASIIGPAAAGFVRNALKNGDFDLYLLRARLYGGNQWSLRGFRLLGTNGNDGSVGLGNADQSDPIQQRFPSTGFLHETY